MIERDYIIKVLHEKLLPLPFIYALWLEGADANDTLDEFSDLDFWVDFEDKYENEAVEAVENALSGISEIDYKHVADHGHPKIRQRVYHLKGTSEYLMIDFCWQLHSRSQEEYSYFINDKIEAAKVIFDKGHIICQKECDLKEFAELNAARVREAKYRYSQHSRVIKYIRRRQYLEAYAYYNRYVLEPLADLLRVIYTPAHADYYFVHISHHIPEKESKHLEYFAKISSFEDIEKKVSEAKEWFGELLFRVKGESVK